jgi:hypothetical protein
MGYDADELLFIDAIFNFEDPLMQNKFGIPISYREKKNTIVGVTYQNNAYALEFGAGVYNVDKNKTDDTQRDNGVDVFLHYPFLSKGYWNASSTLSYTKAYSNLYREPLTLSFDILNYKQFGFSKYPNSLNALSFFTSKDRDTNIFGASYKYEHDIPWQIYLGFNSSYFESNIVNHSKEKGVEIRNTLTLLQSDFATVNMPTLKYTYYAKNVKVAELNFKKVFDISSYHFSVPVSLQRESIYLKQRLYDINFTDKLNKQYHETIVGLEMDILFLHKLTIPLSFEYLYNPDIQEKEQFRVMFGGLF